MAGSSAVGLGKPVSLSFSTFNLKVKGPFRAGGSEHLLETNKAGAQTLSAEETDRNWWAREGEQTLTAGSITLRSEMLTVTPVPNTGFFSLAPIAQ